MLQLVLDTRDVKMGNEDTWVLCFDDKSGKFFVQHSWSHRKSGAIIDFESGREECSTAEFRDLIATQLKRLGFSTSHSAG